MTEAELSAYIVQLRSKLDDGKYTAEDAYRFVWNEENPLSYDQRVHVHQALELGEEVPDEFNLIVPEPIRGE
ncbi:MAG: hypothetical protein JST12_02570 [Armatimonadetes bacterium]|nr:hypothetical protein [Armatimonadota bacterium]MBS1700518.1 hypothetical protein [Armatimonadota bacterium]MBS1728997.1 hypothetical protein [Armatimonadota bacterium]